MTGLLYIISPSADHKLINSFLLYIRDWEYGLGDQFKLITTENINDLNPLANAEPTSPPLQSFTNNAWVGRTLQDVELFHLSLNHSSLYLVLDDASVQTQTCILGHQATIRDADTGKFVHTRTFKKFRIPWDELYMTWCNLDVANMGFEDFTQDRDGTSDGNDGWFVYANHAEGKDLSEANLERRNAELERLRVAGLV